MVFNIPLRWALFSALLIDEKKTNLKVSGLGHFSLLINIDGYSILTDPIFESKVSPVRPTRFNKEFPLKIQDLPSVDVIIISHDHYNHLNKFSIQQLSGKTDVFLVPLRVGKRLALWGVPEQTVQVHLDLKGKVLQPIHWATFNLALHPWYEPMGRLIAAAWNRGISLSTQVIGGLVDFHDPQMMSFWWVPAMQKGGRLPVTNEMAYDERK